MLTNLLLKVTGNGEELASIVTLPYRLVWTGRLTERKLSLVNCLNPLTVLVGVNVLPVLICNLILSVAKR